MEKHIEFTLESAHYGGDKLGHDLIFRFDFEGVIKVNGLETALPVSPAIINPKFDRQTDNALKLPATIYSLPLQGTPGGTVNAVCHVHITEVDKISDYGDGAVLPITFDVLDVEDTHYELEVPVVSHGGDRGRIALFLLKFRLRMKG